MSAEKQKNHPAERIYPAEYNARNDKENSSAGKKWHQMEIWINSVKEEMTNIWINSRLFHTEFLISLKDMWLKLQHIKSLFKVEIKWQNKKDEGMELYYKVPKIWVKWTQDISWRHMVISWRRTP